jgi:cytochrome c oxidase assembly factor CtaG
MTNLHHVASGSGWFPLSLTLTIVFAALVYLRGWLRLRSTSSNAISAWRAGSFLAGLFLIWITLASAIAAYDHELLTVHMIQHLLLMTLAPPLIWLGEPVLPFLQGLPRPFVHAVIGLLFRWQPVQELGRILAQPAFCWLAAFAALVVWHIPAAFMLGLQSERWHILEQASFLATGLLFWWPVLQPWPSISKPDLSIILYLFLATLPCDILSGLLVFGDRVVYPVYFSSSRPFGLSALADQQCAGALMWTCVTIVYLVTGTILTARLLSPESSGEHELVRSPSRGGAAPQRARQGLEVL